MERAINVLRSSMPSRHTASGQRPHSPINDGVPKQSRTGDLEGTFLDSIGVLVEFSSSNEIYTFDDPADHIYKVVSGAVRVCKLLDDGRRYIGAFYLRGDVFGLESGPRHTYSCEAVCPTTIRMISRNVLTGSSSYGRSAELEILAIATSEMQRAQMHSSLLVKTASERVVNFLLQMSIYNIGPATFQLPMSRQDIADYLGLTIETVSRIFTQLEDSGIILRTPLRHIVVRDKHALEQMDG